MLANFAQYAGLIEGVLQEAGEQWPPEVSASSAAAQDRLVEAVQGGRFPKLRRALRTCGEDALA